MKFAGNAVSFLESGIGLDLAFNQCGLSGDAAVQGQGPEEDQENAAGQGQHDGPVAFRRPPGRRSQHDQVVLAAHHHGYRAKLAPLVGVDDLDTGDVDSAALGWQGVWRKSFGQSHRDELASGFEIEDTTFASNELS